MTLLQSLDDSTINIILVLLLLLLLLLSLTLLRIDKGTETGVLSIAGLTRALPV